MLIKSSCRDVFVKKYNHKERKYNSPINIELCVYATPLEKDNFFCIEFFMVNKDRILWRYYDEKTRDTDYESISISLDKSKNVSYE